MAPMALPPDRLAAIEATGRELVALAMRTHGALSLSLVPPGFSFFFSFFFLNVIT